MVSWCLLFVVCSSFNMFSWLLCVVWVVGCDVSFYIQCLLLVVRRSVFGDCCLLFVVCRSWCDVRCCLTGGCSFVVCWLQFVVC